jgi:hypothetical protein
MPAMKHAKRQERANRGKPIDLKVIDAWTLMNTPEEQLYLEPVINDPVRTALKKQLNDLGETPLSPAGQQKSNAVGRGGRCKPEAAKLGHPHQHHRQELGRRRGGK